MFVIENCPVDTNVKTSAIMVLASAMSKLSFLADVESNKLRQLVAERHFALRNASLSFLVNINAIFNATKVLAYKLIKLIPAESFAANKGLIASIFALSYVTQGKNVNLCLVKLKFWLNVSVVIDKLWLFAVLMTIIKQRNQLFATKSAKIRSDLTLFIKISKFTTLEIWSNLPSKTTHIFKIYKPDSKNSFCIQMITS